MPSSLSPGSALEPWAWEEASGPCFFPGATGGGRGGEELSAAPHRYLMDIAASKLPGALSLVTDLQPRRVGTLPHWVEGSLP